MSIDLTFERFGLHIEEGGVDILMKECRFNDIQ